MVLTFSSILALRKAYPKAKIYSLCSPMNVGLLKSQNTFCPKLLDKIIVWEDIWDMHGALIPGFKHLIKFIKEIIILRKEKFDIVIQPVPLSIWTLFSLLLNSKQVIATINESLFLARLLRKHVTYPNIIKRLEYVHCFDQSANCLLPLGINNIKKGELSYDINVIKKRFKKITQYKNIVINISSGDVARKLPNDRLSLLINKLVNKLTTYKILIVGTREDGDFANALVERSQDKIFSFVGKTNINDLIYIFKHSEILITPDTGTMHLASLTDIYIVAYFGAGNLKHFAPITNNCTIIKHELGCSGCGDICFTDELPKPCIKAISVDEIIMDL